MHLVMKENFQNCSTTSHPIVSWCVAADLILSVCGCWCWFNYCWFIAVTAFEVFVTVTSKCITITCTVDAFWITIWFIAIHPFPLRWALTCGHTM
jgi:hypothetical protein